MSRDQTEGVDTMDDALALLRDHGHGGGNHAPMGAEALVAIGRGDLVVSWVEGYIRRGRMEARPMGTPIPAAEQAGALGDAARIGDWNTTFRRAVAETPWPDVLRSWLPRLMPGLAAAATHGIIRTAHATRSLERSDTALRKAELADALAYWAAFSQPIAPLSTAAAAEPRLASSALAEVPIVPASKRHRGMVPSLQARADDPRFVAIANAARPADGQEEAFLGDLTAAFARLYVKWGADHPIPFIHAVTGPAAVRLLLPYLDRTDQRAAMVYAWQTAAGLWSSFAPGPAPSSNARALPEPSATRWQAALEQAVDGGDVHAIKLAEVCWREARVAPDPAVYLAAARDVAERL